MELFPRTMGSVRHPTREVCDLRAGKHLGSGLFRCRVGSDSLPAMTKVFQHYVVVVLGFIEPGNHSLAHRDWRNK